MRRADIHLTIALTGSYSRQLNSTMCQNEEEMLEMQPLLEAVLTIMG
jgi:hypothetical protein